jgi:hypothetical protein
MGRPTRDPAGSARSLVLIRVTDNEKATYQRAAEEAGLKLSEWMRDRLDRAAKREIGAKSSGRRK